jgi:hypothetical protein
MWGVPLYVVDATEAVLRGSFTVAELEELSPVQSAVLSYLYSKQLVLAHEKSLAVAVVSNPESDTFARVSKLLSRPHDSHLYVLPSDWQTFAKFAQCSPWEHSATSTVFFRDTVPGCVVYRAGGCPARAGIGPGAAAAGAVVTWHYIEAARKGRCDVPVVDATTYVRNHLPRTELVRYVFDGVLRPTRMLEALCNSSELYTEAVSGLTAAEIQHRFDDHGPLLLSNVKATRDLLDCFVLTHAHPPPHTDFMDVVSDRHTGVIVGHRFNGGDVMFLVQAFWRPKQFYECSLAFLQSSEALVTTLLEKAACSVM